MLNAKQELRTQAHKRRAQAKEIQSPHDQKKLIKTFFQAIAPAQDQKIALYYPVGTEWDIWPLALALWDKHYQVALPKVTSKNQPLSFYPWSKDTQLMLNTSIPGLKEPDGIKSPVIPDVVCVPLLAIDVHGTRLGYGGGYYDRTLAHLRTIHTTCKAIGIGFSVQYRTYVPKEAHDQLLDGWLSEKGYHVF